MTVAFSFGVGLEVSRELGKRDGYEEEESKYKPESKRINRNPQG